MHVAATTYEPFARDLRRIDTPDEWMIERVPSDAQLARHIERWRTLVDQGWDITALVAGDSKTVVALGCRGAC